MVLLARNGKVSGVVHPTQVRRLAGRFRDMEAEEVVARSPVVANVGTLVDDDELESKSLKASRGD